MEMESYNQLGSLSRKSTLHFDDIFIHLGQCNRYFGFAYVITSLAIASAGWNAISLLFYVPGISHWCRIPELDQQCQELHLDHNECLKLKLSMRPLDNANTKTIDEQSCRQYHDGSVYNVSYDGLLTNASKLNETLQFCGHGYEYDNTTYVTSVTQEFDLVCRNAYRIPLLQSMEFVGILIGAFIFGNISDRFGRKFTIILCLLMVTVFNLVSMTSRWYWMFLLCRILISIFNMGSNITAFVHACELVGPKRRCLAGCILSMQWSIGYMLSSLYAYLVPTWRIRIVVISITDAFLIMLICFFVPESPRWLHARNNVDRAKKILLKACKFSESDVAETECVKLCEHVSSGEELLQEASSKSTAIELLRHRNIRIRFFVIMFIWFVNAMVYYGLSLLAVTFGFNDFLENALAGFVEIPAVIMAWFAIEHWGRRVVMCCLMILTGLTCAATSFVSSRLLILIVGLCGKFGISAAFAVLYVFAAEIYPTPIRNSAIGISSMIGNLGGILAPQVLYARVVTEQLPYIVFGGLSMAAGCIALLLPETKGLKLPHTIMEGEVLGTESPDAVPTGDVRDVGYIIVEGHDNSENLVLQTTI